VSATVTRGSAVPEMEQRMQPPGTEGSRGRQPGRCPGRRRGWRSDGGSRAARREAAGRARLMCRRSHTHCHRGRRRPRRREADRAAGPVRAHGAGLLRGARAVDDGGVGSLVAAVKQLDDGLRLLEDVVEQHAAAVHREGDAPEVVAGQVVDAEVTGTARLLGWRQGRASVGPDTKKASPSRGGGTCLLRTAGAALHPRGSRVHAEAPALQCGG
jgi:hypothetical protein